ncbi:hypothetical protein ACP70R_029594 [Stipagrostis hirtigluma subsp. patula]
MEYVLRSPAGPPPPPVADRSPREQEERPPLALPPPPPLGSSRPERLADRLGAGARGAAEGRRGWRRSASPGAGEGRRRRRSPPRRSPSPAPRKRSRRGRGRHTWNCSPDRPHSGYDDTSNGHGQDNTQREGLRTYKQFTQILEDDVSPAEAESRYQEYKTEYITSQKRDYFDLNKNEDWLKDKYHPTNLLSAIERRNELCKTVAKDLILDLRTGTLDIGPGFTASAASKSGNGNHESSEGNADYGDKKRIHGRGPRKEIEALSAVPKAHPVSSQYRRIQIDVDRTLALVKKLDSEKGIVGNILSAGDHDKSNVDKSNVRSMGPIVIVRGLNTAKGLEGVELLDTLLTYLWRVHGVDYYGMSEMKYPKGFRHVRAENNRSSNIDAADWEKKLDFFWEERLMNGEDPLVVLTAKDKIDAATVEVLEPYVRKIRDEKYVWKYGCGAKGCAKLFHAPEFVHKHLRLKHPDLVSVLTSKVEDDIYFQNYMNDPEAPGGTPVMQRSGSIHDRIKRSPDEHMVDATNGRGSNAAPVPELSPPPLLIPVPGAGPLGPFVPAPPEIAMQMMQQGHPERNGEHRKPAKLGRRIPMYPSLPLDRRPLRSYKDLDTPVEEIVVVDYRSL